jgi:hypothetical protein
MVVLMFALPGVGVTATALATIGAGGGVARLTGGITGIVYAALGVAGFLEVRKVRVTVRTSWDGHEDSREEIIERYSIQNMLNSPSCPMCDQHEARPVLSCPGVDEVFPEV